MAFIDIVYKLQDDEKGNKCLKYSLRSLAYFRDIRNVYIIGYKPDWITNVKHIYTPDHHTIKNKNGNLINKIIVACSQKEISENFIEMSDDQIFMRPVDIEYFKIPVYNNGILNNKMGYTDGNYFYQRVLNTVQVLRENKFNQNIFETHAPYLINKHKYPHVALYYNYWTGLGLCGNTLYYNSIGEFGIQRVNHVKRLRTESDIIQNTGDYYFLNLCDQSETEENFNILESMFPNKSSYEL